MEKTYRAYGSVLSLGVYAHGTTIRAEFTPVSNYDGRGGSIFSTDDEEIQQAMESRADFGTLFVEVDNKSWDEHNDEEPAAESTEQVREMKNVKVESIADAKIWLIDNCGWKPSSRVTKKSLVEAADSYCIVFEGI